MATDTYIVRLMFEQEAADDPVDDGKSVLRSVFDKISIDLAQIEHVAGPDEIARENRVEYRVKLAERGEHEAALRAAFFEADPYTEVEAVTPRRA